MVPLWRIDPIKHNVDTENKAITFLQLSWDLEVVELVIRPFFAAACTFPGFAEKPSCVNIDMLVRQNVMSFFLWGSVFVSGVASKYNIAC